MKQLGRIAILGGGTWATALAKIVLTTVTHVNWYTRRAEQVGEFMKLGHNPSYLSNIPFNMDRITFYTDISQAVENSDTLILTVPSPFLKNHLEKLSVSLDGKLIISAIKGIVPPENLLVIDYLTKYYNVPIENLAIIEGLCHAEEIAMKYLIYPTIACSDRDKAKLIAQLFTNRFLKPSVSTDVVGIELAAVLKNVYAIASGVSHGLKYGDNFQAILASNALEEMNRFVQIVSPSERNIMDSAYMRDLLVTTYSSFSRNRTL